MVGHQPQQSKSGRRRLIIWFLTILILATGTVIFLQSGSDLIETDILLPVHPLNLMQGTILSKIANNVVEVHVRGPKPLILELPGMKLAYDMDLQKMTVGRHDFTVHADAFGLPKGITVLSVEPSVLSLTIEKELKKSLPILAKFKGDPRPDFYISDTVVKPSRVTVCGPESILAPIDELITKPVDIQGVAESIRKETALQLPDGIKLHNPLLPIMVDIAVREKQVEKRFDAIPVKGENTAYNFNLTPQNVSITIKGPKSRIETLSPFDSINVYIDLKDLKPGIYVRRATIALPVNLVLIGIEPENFTAVVHPDN